MYCPLSIAALAQLHLSNMQHLCCFRSDCAYLIFALQPFYRNDNLQQLLPFVINITHFLSAYLILYPQVCAFSQPPENAIVACLLKQPPRIPKSMSIPVSSFVSLFRCSKVSVCLPSFLRPSCVHLEVQFYGMRFQKILRNANRLMVLNDVSNYTY